MVAQAEPTKPSKRRVRAPSQSVRERAAEAQASANKPSKKRHLKAASNTASKPFKKISKVFHRQPFRFIGKVLAPKFVRNAFKELTLVTWPNARETRRLTFAVLIFAIVFGAIVGGVDYVLDKIFKALLIT